MERAPQVAHADGLALLDRTAQLRRIEPIDPRPQSDIRVGRFLRLHADQVLDHLERRPPDPLDQELPGEQGAVEGAAREHPLVRGAGGRHERLARSNASSVSAENRTNVTVSSDSGCSAIHASTAWSATLAAASTG